MSGGGTMGEKVELVARPWPNGTAWDIWEANNCDQCVKEETCDLIGDLFLHGGLTAETATRMGWQPEYQKTGRWYCAEKQTEPIPPKPAAREMADAVATQLPGFDTLPAAPTSRGYPD